MTDSPFFTHTPSCRFFPFFNTIPGDLHAGNILVRHHGRELIFLDAGIVVELGDREADCLVDLFACIVTGDGLGAGELMLARSRSSECTDKGVGRGVHEGIRCQFTMEGGRRIGSFLLTIFFSLFLLHALHLHRCLLFRRSHVTPFHPFLQKRPSWVPWLNWSMGSWAKKKASNSAWCR